MAKQQNVAFHKTTGLKAGADLSAYQFHYCNLEADGDVNVTNVEVGALGILLNKPTAGKACEIAGPGSIVGAHGGATFAPGDMLMVENADVGKLIKATNDHVYVAQALEAGADGSVTKVRLTEPTHCADVSKVGVANA